MECKNSMDVKVMVLHGTIDPNKKKTYIFIKSNIKSLFKSISSAKIKKKVDHVTDLDVHWL